MRSSVASPEGASPALSPTVKGLSLVSLLNDFASEMVYPLLPAFVIGTLGGTPTTLAALDGAAELAAAATKWWSGARSDRTGWRRPLILVGYALAVLVRPVLAGASAAWQVVALRVVDRLGKGVRTPPRDALIAEVTAPEARGRAFGFYRMADHFGSVPGALLAWWLLSNSVKVRDVLTLSVVPGIFAFIVLLVVLKNAPPASPASPAAHEPADATGRVFWVPVLILALLVLCRLPETLLLLRLQDLGVSVASIPLVWAALHVVRTAVSYPGGWLADHVGTRRTVAAGGFAFATGVALLGAAASVTTGVAVFLTMGVVAGLMEPAERALVARLAPRRMGRGFGDYHAVTGVAALPAALMFGAVYQGRGGGDALWLSAALMLPATMGWLWASRTTLHMAHS